MSAIAPPPVATAASQSWFATCPKGVEALLFAELSTLGAQSVRETVAGVHFEGQWALAYRACLWSRLANRILWPLGQLDAVDADTLYASLRAIQWGELFTVDKTITIDFSGENHEIRNTQFGAQRSKDAVVDWFEEKFGERPSVDRARPQVRINIRLVRETAYLSIDLSGGSLHQRGYRLSAGAAPLKENLAAAILLRADWPGMAARGGALLDPMCGSATLLLEGAMMAADIAPALGRQQFGFEHLRIHEPRQWQALLSDAQGRAERGRAVTLPEIRGYDADQKVIRRAEENIARLGLEKSVRVSCKPITELAMPTHRPMPIGLLVCNPPYGERLGEKDNLLGVYRDLGRVMSQEFSGWQAAIFTSDLDLGKATGLRSHKRYALFNGAIATSLLLFDLTDNKFRDTQPQLPTGNAMSGADAAPAELSEGARMFANRIRKNRKRLSSWLRRDQVECYRLYDADMPEYSVAVDIYGNAAHVAEYRAPKEVSPEDAARRMREIQHALPEALGLPPEDIVYKQRSRQKGDGQYQKLNARGELRRVKEAGAYLLVNLRDYLDTGLFLDHRPLRLRINAEAQDKDFLNLYCYTGTATVQAALGGARSTTSVDSSNTYLEWLGKNLAQNSLQANSHEVVKADCQAWLEETRQQFDLVLLDPPSFSNSKSREHSFDVQRDHVLLVQQTMKQLRQDGTVYFSNNRRDFKLDPQVESEFLCEDITRSTLGPDFQRNRKIHSCWMIRHR